MNGTPAGRGHMSTTYPAKVLKGDITPAFMIDLAKKRPRYSAGALAAIGCIPIFTDAGGDNLQRRPTSGSGRTGLDGHL